jgi:modulator of FtsH protease HflK
MLTYWRIGSTFVAEKLRRTIGALMALNDPQWGRRGNEPPDLDEMVRNFQKKLKTWFGIRDSGNGQRPPVGGGDGMFSFGGSIGWLIALVVAVWLASGFYIVNANQRGIVLRFGKFVEETEPGARWHLPYPIETVDVINVSEVRSLEIGYRGTAQTKVLQESLMLTDDANIVDVQFAVQYVLKDPRDFLFNNRFADPDAKDSVLQAAETAIREIVGKSTMDFVLNEGRAQVAADAQNLMQKILDRYKTGISISKVTMQNAQPPDQVQAAFADVVKAAQDRDRQKNEGEAYANDVIPRAQGAAARLTQEAEGYRQRVIERAEGDASRFRQIAVEYNKAPGVTRERLYLEAIQDIMSNTSKVLIDQKGSGSNLLYLPLDKLFQMTAPALAPPVAPPPADTSKPADSAVSDTDTDTDSGVPPLSRSRDEFRSRDREDR